MGLLLSVVISYAGVHDAIECIKFIVSGMVPETEPDFTDLVQYYNTLLQRTANPYSNSDWTIECGQGYLCLSEDKNGKLKSAAVKYYDGKPDSTAILFSTKISSFGQDSVDSAASSQANGDLTERYTASKTKTLISNTSESFSIGYRNRSPTPSENISDPNRFSENSFERDEHGAEDNNEAKEKLTWHYRPLSPTPQPLPEIHFQSFDGEQTGDAYSEEYLRSLDGLKFRPLQRSDPSGRRRSFKKRHSSSSTSSRDSRASREEELKMFTSLEEAEFARISNEPAAGFGSTPNLAARSNSRSRSRENSKEKSWSMEASVDTADDDLRTELKPRLKDLPKLSSFEEEKEEKEEMKETNEVTEEEEEDFWGSSGD